MSPPNAIDDPGQPHPGTASGAAVPSGTPDTVPCHDAVALTQGGSVALISLNGQRYALRITRQGKLILTK